MVSPSCPWVPHLGIQPTVDGNFNLSLVESVDVKPVNREDHLYIFFEMKKAHISGSCAVQTHVFQRSTVFEAGKRRKDEYRG